MCVCVCVCMCVCVCRDTPRVVSLCESHMLQCAAVCCIVLQCVVVRCNVLQYEIGGKLSFIICMLQWVVVRGSVL